MAMDLPADVHFTDPSAGWTLDQTEDSFARVSGVLARRQGDSGGVGHVHARQSGW